MVAARGAVLPLVVVGLFPATGAAQTLTGRVVEEGSSAPVPGALVSLVDRGGDRRVGTTTDSMGCFVLSPQEPGEYVVESSALGYEKTRSPLFALAVQGTASLEITIRPLPVGLEGFEVSVEREAEQLLRNFGMTPAALGNRWIDRRDIEEMPLPAGPREAIRWRNIAGVSVAETSGVIGPLAELCVMFRRGRRGVGMDQCALILLNGVRVSLVEAQNVDPHDLEGIAVLTPVEATTFYGTGASGGAVLMWTRSGGR